MRYDPKFEEHWKAAGMTDTKETAPMKKVLYGYWCAGYKDGVEDMKALNLALDAEECQREGDG